MSLINFPVILLQQCIPSTRPVLVYEASVLSHRRANLSVTAGHAAVYLGINTASEKSTWIFLGLGLKWPRIFLEFHAFTICTAALFACILHDIVDLVAIVNGIVDYVCLESRWKNFFQHKCDFRIFGWNRRFNMSIKLQISYLTMVTR